MRKIQFLLVKKFKNTESAQLWKIFMPNERAPGSIVPPAVLHDRVFFYSIDSIKHLHRSVKQYDIRDKCTSQLFLYAT